MGRCESDGQSGVQSGAAESGLNESNCSQPADKKHRSLLYKALSFLNLLVTQQELTSTVSLGKIMNSLVPPFLCEAKRGSSAGEDERKEAQLLHMVITQSLVFCQG